MMLTFAVQGTLRCAEDTQPAAVVSPSGARTTFQQTRHLRHAFSPSLRTAHPQTPYLTCERCSQPFGTNPALTRTLQHANRNHSTSRPSSNLEPPLPTFLLQRRNRCTRSTQLTSHLLGNAIREEHQGTPIALNRRLLRILLKRPDQAKYP